MQHHVRHGNPAEMPPDGTVNAAGFPWDGKVWLPRGRNCTGFPQECGRIGPLQYTCGEQVKPSSNSFKRKSLRACVNRHGNANSSSSSLTDEDKFVRTGEDRTEVLRRRGGDRKRGTGRRQARTGVMSANVQETGRTRDKTSDVTITSPRAARPCGHSTDLHIYNLDAVPPIHVVSNHVDTDKLTTANGGTFTSSSASRSSQ